jgi:monothiol glutaredoxin
LSSSTQTGATEAISVLLWAQTIYKLILFPLSNFYLIMTTSTTEKIGSLIADNKIMVFMKGNKLMPQCGFSNQVVQILNILGVPYETVDVLADPEIRQGIKEYSNWPTIPQVYIDGEFIGGSDVMTEMYQKGELQQKVEVALAS